MSSGEIVRYAGESQTALEQFRPPTQVLAEAREAAKALTEVINLKPKPVIFNGEKYLEFEDWQTVAKFYGCTVKIVSTNFVQFGDVRGWEATAIVLDRNQSEISRADSMCLSDEENWGMIPKYEWKDTLDANGKKIWDDRKKRYKAERVHVGDVPKPLFQLRSMAQTRASARALRQVFAWVVVLAGYRPSVAEEMTGDENPQGPPPEEETRRQSVTQPRRASEKAAEEKQQAPQPAQQTSDQGERISGKIADPREGKEGSMWFHLDGKLVVVESKFVDDSIVVGATFTAKAHKKHNSRIGDFYQVFAVLENPPEAEGEVIEGEIVEETPEGEASPAEQAKENAPQGDVEDLVASGAVKKGSEVGQPTGNGKTIGSKRAQRLWALMNQNKKTTGLTEETIRSLLKGMRKPTEHLSELEIGLHEMFEHLMIGKVTLKDVEEALF